MIYCKPKGLCSWDYNLEGEIDGSIDIDWFGESGDISIGSETYTAEKEGIFSGTWFLNKNGKTIATAEKESLFTRSISISYMGKNFSLDATSAFFREMVLRGPGTDLTIAPAHSFTRRATISGQVLDPALTAFAFWLTVLLWRRAAKNNSD